MKYLVGFNESIEKYWDFREVIQGEEISDIFQDFVDEGFKLDDYRVGASLSIYPKKWCTSNELDTRKNKPIKSLSITLEDTEYNKFDISKIDILDKCIKHFENFYNVKLDSILVSGLNITYSGGVSRYNYFNSCQTIKDIYLRNKDKMAQKYSNLKSPLYISSDVKFTLTFDLT